MKTFLISPVRGQSPDAWRAHVAALEAQGYEVHWPHRDTNQEDDVGLRICADNMKAIREADAVHVIWDGKSQGCVFDLGMAFAIGKKVIPILLPEATSGKSFQNMVRAWAEHRLPMPDGLQFGWVVDGKFFDDRVAADLQYRKTPDANPVTIRWTKAA